MHRAEPAAVARVNSDLGEGDLARRPIIFSTTPRSARFVTTDHRDDGSASHSLGQGSIVLESATRSHHRITQVICPTCQNSDRPGLVVVGGNAYTPCPTCDGSRVASCCDGAVPCDGDVIDEHAAIDDA
jgi:hypothetical protein